MGLSHGITAWTLIEGEVGIIDTNPFQRGDHAVELSDIGHGSDAYPIHSAPGDLIVAHEYLAVTAAAQFLRQPFGIRGVGERAGLHEQREAGRRGA